MASNTSRASLGLRPPPALRTYSLEGSRRRSGSSGSTRCQKSSDTSHAGNLFFVACFAISDLPPFGQAVMGKQGIILFTDKLLVEWLVVSSKRGFDFVY